MPTLIDLSHTIFDGLITYKGLPAPIICGYLRWEKSKVVKNTLRSNIKGVYGIDQAVNLLSSIAEPVGV